MKDPQPASDVDAEKVWATREDHNGYLYEYKNKDEFRTNKHPKRYILDRKFYVSYRLSMSLIGLMAKHIIFS